MEGWGFRKLIRGLLPDFIVSADSIKRDIMNTYNKRKILNLISIILSFVLIPYPHTGINIANCIKAEVDGWSITTKVIIIDFRIALRLGFNKLIMRYNFI